MTGTSFGADRATLLRLYKSLVLPIIEYGAVIYAGGSKTALKTIDTLQKLMYSHRSWHYEDLANQRSAYGGTYSTTLYSKNGAHT